MTTYPELFTNSFSNVFPFKLQRQFLSSLSTEGEDIESRVFGVSRKHDITTN